MSLPFFFSPSFACLCCPSPPHFLVLSSSSFHVFLLRLTHKASIWEVPLVLLVVLFVSRSSSAFKCKTICLSVFPSQFFLFIYLFIYLWLGQQLPWLKLIFGNTSVFLPTSYCVDAIRLSPSLYSLTVPWLCSESPLVDSFTSLKIVYSQWFIPQYGEISNT